MGGGDLSVSGGDLSVGGAEGALRPVTTAGVHRDIVVTLKGMSSGSCNTDCTMAAVTPVQFHCSSGPGLAGGVL